MPAFTTTGYDAFLYPDRNLYRPGEMMHLRWLVRQADGTPLKDAPLKLRLVDSTENAKEFTSTLSTWGSGSLDLETARDWLTGAYTLGWRTAQIARTSEMMTPRTSQCSGHPQQ